MKKRDIIYDIGLIVGVPLNDDEKERLHHLTTAELKALAAYMKRAKTIFESTPGTFGTPAVKIADRVLPLTPAPTDDLCPMHGHWPENPAPSVICTCNRAKDDGTINRHLDEGTTPPPGVSTETMHRMVDKTEDDAYESMLPDNSQAVEANRRRVEAASDPGFEEGAHSPTCKCEDCDPGSAAAAEMDKYK